MDRIWRIALGILLSGLCGWVLTTPAYAKDSAEDELTVALPPNFIARTVVSGFTLPTDMAILPSGDFLVIEKGVGSGVFSKAQVRLVRAGVLQPGPVLTLNVNSLADSGLMGIVLDPQFAQNNYFYLWHSTGEGSLGWNGVSYNRLSRFVFNGGRGTADPASETIILDNVTWSSIHNGGGLAFDGAGNLLLTTGDAEADYNFPSSHPSQSLKSLNGKVLRIRPRAEGGYDVPGDNPYVGNNQGFLPEIYASGLRNPFRITRHTATNQFYLADVGQETWEEANLLVAGANYGWPYREGKCAAFERENCTSTPREFTDPVVVYLHPEGLGAGITGIAFYEGDRWPAEYRGRMFFADFDSDWVSMADLANPSRVMQFATGLGAVVDMEATTEGIYALSIYDQSIKFIYYDVESNHPPTVSWIVSPTVGSAPLSVEFAATAEDLDNDDLTYWWNFGDGNVLSGTVPSASHVYGQDGDYLATLQVIDEDDGASEILTQLVQVYSGARAAIVQENLTEAGRVLYRGGDTLRFRAERSGGNEGLDPTTPYAWTILLHHNEHAHVQVAEYANSEVLLDIPMESHALGAPLWYEVRLAMRTANGQVIRNTLEVRPQTTTIQAQSWPGPARILLDRQLQNPDDLTVVIVGQEHILEAPERIVYHGKVGKFRNWVVTASWPAANIAGETEIITERVYELVAPVEAQSYVAFYEYVGPATQSFLPSLYR